MGDGSHVLIDTARGRNDLVESLVDVGVSINEVGDGKCKEALLGTGKLRRIIVFSRYFTFAIVRCFFGNEHVF